MNDVMICGIDEAGRGPIIGPMVVAAVAVSDDSLLRYLNVKDSKKLKPSKRSELADAIRKIARIETIVIDVDEIDRAVEIHCLNELETEKFSELINRLRPQRAYVDAADTDLERFGKMISKRLVCSTELICEHKADETYSIVSAASIIAKTMRDDMMKNIERELNRPIGSGYPSDPTTRAFLDEWVITKGELPPYTRRSWTPAKKAFATVKNSKIDEWMDKNDIEGTVE
ncbi:MAG: ribonuclease HII [Methanomassiliicoccales archaeon]|nr:ribonuclease HII [Methanomassiliicoccales archaeon]